MFAVPEMMTTAAGELATIGSDLGAVHLAAAAPTTTLIPAAADEVSTAVAQLFSRYGTGFQALTGKASAFHDQFVQTLKSNASAYTGTEAANAAALKPAQGELAGLLQAALTLFEQNPLEFLGRR